MPGNDTLTVWTASGPYHDEFGSLANGPHKLVGATPAPKPLVPRLMEPKAADEPLRASTAPEPHLPPDNAAIDRAQDNIAANLQQTFERYVTDFLRRPSYDRLERIRIAGMSMLDHELGRLRSQQEPAGIGMSDRSF